ncbi:MAG: hypothetical protein IPP97_11290 [Candidatus Obscuribacter sp.]|nr:hypothetical protein [Candidatus Obscuribacter sp.]MBP6349542.1 hypothetical protein [Candidatus Obscuribacter sp.]MBP6594476.1 hypothetical protein [Candidatus Obscuribacter sp.]
MTNIESTQKPKWQLFLEEMDLPEELKVLFGFLMHQRTLLGSGSEVFISTDFTEFARELLTLDSEPFLGMQELAKDYGVHVRRCRNDDHGRASENPAFNELRLYVHPSEEGRIWLVVHPWPMPHRIEGRQGQPEQTFYRQSLYAYREHGYKSGHVVSVESIWVLDQLQSRLLDSLR